MLKIILCKKGVPLLLCNHHHSDYYNHLGHHNNIYHHHHNYITIIAINNIQGSMLGVLIVY